MKNRRLAIACGILLLASLFLLYQLDAKSLWVDELFSVRMAHSDFGSILSDVVRDFHPPLYFLLLRIWVIFAGDSDFAVRFLSVIWGLLSLPLVYRLGTAIVHTKLGLLTTCLLAASPFFVLFSRMARYYSMAMFLGLASCLLFIEFLKRGTRRTLLIYILFSTSALYTFYLTAPSLAAQAAYLLLGRRTHASRAKAWFLSQLVLLVLFSPWLVIMTQQMGRADQMLEADFARGLLTYTLKLGYPLYSFSLGETIFPWHPLAVAGMGVFLFLLLSGSAYLKQKGQLAALLFIIIPLVVTVLTVTHVSTGTPFLNVPSRTIFAAPFFYLVVAGGLLWMRSRRWQTVLFLVITIAWGCSLRNYYASEQFHNPVYVIPAREMATQVATASEPGDVIVSDWDSGFGHYYAKLDEPAAHFFSRSSEETQRYIKTHDSPRVWLITIGRDRTRSLTPVEFIRWLEEDYELRSTWGYAEQDETYRRIKEMLLQRPAYEYKAVVQLYTRR